jgi:hypothetical protein
MFIAKFTQTTGNPFTADKNGQMPFIGNVLAGNARGTLMNGTIFNRTGLQANKLYLCDNSVDPDYPDNVRVDIICEVSPMEFMDMRAKLGSPSVNIGNNAQVPANADEPELI